jgi:hypothetical protein
MCKKILFLLFACQAANPLQAQIMITDMGTVMYYNSLDSAKSAVLNHIASRVFCLLQLGDSTRTIHAKLNLDLSRDTTYYSLAYDNLAGTASTLRDSGLSVADKPEGDLGISIRARDSVLDQEKILRLIDYGVRNYAYLQATRFGATPPNPELVGAIFQPKITPRLQRWLGRCK